MQSIYNSLERKKAKQNFIADYNILYPAARINCPKSYSPNDFLSDLYLKMMTNDTLLDGYLEKGPGYLIVTMKRMKLDVYRNTKRHRTRQEILKSQQAEGVDIHHFDMGFLTKVLEQLFRAALNDKQLSVMVLFATGYPYKDIAVALEIPIDTVSTRISRSRKALVKYLTGQEGREVDKMKVKELRTLLKKYL